jgi:hypothetical protein
MTARHHPGWRHVGVWEGQMRSARYVPPRLRLLLTWEGRAALRYAHAVGMHLTADQRFRGRPRPTNIHISVRGTEASPEVPID